MANGNFGGGDGSVATPFLVEDDLDLLAVVESPALNFKQVADINLSKYSDFPTIMRNIYYDGGGFKIQNLRINRSTEYAGLFRNFEVLKNIHVTGGDVRSTNSYVFGLGHGLSTSIITDCSFSGVVSGASYVSGLGSAKMRNSHVSGTVIGTGSRIGGLASTSDDMKNCYSTCDVHGGSRCGGLVGQYSGGAVNCYATGDISGKEYVGGLFGFVLDRAVTSNCFALNKNIYRTQNSTAVTFGDIAPSGDYSTCYSLDSMKFSNA